jgi:hypothetical protein
MKGWFPMAHAHDHSHGDHKLEQICTLIISGLIGLVCVLLYQRNALNLILAKQFHIPVLLGGIGLLVLVGVSALMGFLAPKTPEHVHDCGGHDHCDHEHAVEEHLAGHTCDHNHDHDHAHSHAHDHDHSHTHTHDHQHAADGHDHDGHDHGWNPWRYIVLLLPVVLYFLNMPNGGFSQSYMMRSMHTSELDASTNLGRSVENMGMRIDKATGQDYPSIVAIVEGGAADKAGLKVKDSLVSMTRSTDANGATLAKPETIDFKDMTVNKIAVDLGGKAESKFTAVVERDGKKQDVKVTRLSDVIDLQFLELNDAALSRERREYYSGIVGRLRGQFLPGPNGRMFSLVRVRIRCCAADTTTLNIVIFLDESVPMSVMADIKPQDWIQVTGEIQFRKRKDRDEYATVMVVSKPNGVQKTDPDPEIYLTQ